MRIQVAIILVTSLLPQHAFAKPFAGNTTNDSFSRAKKLMQREIYTEPSSMQTIYCKADFDSKKYITLPSGFTTEVYKKRVKRWEAEHVVPAENFGRAFKEWRDGAKTCVDGKGRAFKGRKCAEKANNEYRLMQSDLYNLYPAVGAVNAARQNYKYVMLPKTARDKYHKFGSCDMVIDVTTHQAQPPKSARGIIARTYLYFDAVYPRYKLSRQQRKLMDVWNTQYPVTHDECERGSKIKAIQGNVNPILAKQCQGL